jgi:hypothetical protein
MLPQVLNINLAGADYEAIDFYIIRWQAFLTLPATVQQLPYLTQGWIYLSYL